MLAVSLCRCTVLRSTASSTCKTRVLCQVTLEYPVSRSSEWLRWSSTCRTEIASSEHHLGTVCCCSTERRPCPAPHFITLLIITWRKIRQGYAVDYFRSSSEPPSQKGRVRHTTSWRRHRDQTATSSPAQVTEIDMQYSFSPSRPLFSSLLRYCSARCRITASPSDAKFPEMRRNRDLLASMSAPWVLMAV
ncbi:hypothetical protein K505DRAFT_148008 [Melanomma pulvis-pyrius CBS 109.77]|uniref:Uncharacterized protein n=1 Tax=Melanomma pulvis-pyrius CBS 109.77 TaxID=1314802 RepID=A0A6A6WR69_9PLEO|nr:hypothetical protein K505DRAFT_148008 [Melanomma pulvis-pyrius CBS 109.77]